MLPDPVRNESATPNHQLDTHPTEQPMSEVHSSTCVFRYIHCCQWMGAIENKKKQEDHDGPISLT